jgi:hypothetical protein
MKLKQSIPFALLAWAACNAPESANPSARCAAESECAPEEICYRGFCVVPPELDTESGAVGGGDPPVTSEPDPSSDPPDGSLAEPPPPALGDAAVPPSREPPPATGPNAGDAPTIGDGGLEPGARPPPGMAAADASVTVDATTPPPAPGCSREVLRQRADRYLAALSAGDSSMLATHAAVRYTENGQMQTLGRGLWSSRPELQFSRTFVDEARCSTITEAVLSELTRRIVLGVRLRYVDELLLEVEAHVVPPNTAYYDPEAVVASGAEPWLEVVPAASRMSRDALTQLAMRYLLSTSDASLLPPHAPTCKRRQNGKLMGPQGSCGTRPGDRPFEEQRFPLVDEQTGVVAAVVIYDRFLGLYLFKAQGGVVESINIVGGAASRTSGW